MKKIFLRLSRIPALRRGINLETLMEARSPLSGKDSNIWRYMDFGRFVSLVVTSSLWFGKCSEFHDDPFEGFCKVKYSESGDLKPGAEPVAVTPDEMIRYFSNNTGQFFQNARDHLYVNSWCLGEESMPMWQIYGAQGQGLVVKSSIDHYKESADFGVRPAQYDFGPVKYHSNLEEAEDIQKDVTESVPLGENLWSQMVQLGFHKRIGYSSEKEWRSVLYQDSRGGKGVEVSFDLERLIDDIYVGPRAPGFVFDAAAAVIEKFGLKKTIRRSTLLDGPVKQA